jgi:hypothetical protein
LAVLVGHEPARRPARGVGPLAHQVGHLPCPGQELRGKGRVRSHCCFRKRGTDSLRKSAIMWMNDSAKRQCDRAAREAFIASRRLGPARAI